MGNSFSVCDHAFENDRFSVSQMSSTIELLPLSLAVSADWAWATYELAPKPFIEESARSALYWMGLVKAHLHHRVEILRMAVCDLSGEVAVLRIAGRWCVLAGECTGEDAEPYWAMYSLEEGGILAAAGSSSSYRQSSEPGTSRTRPVGSVAADPAQR